MGTGLAAPLPYVASGRRCGSPVPGPRVRCEAFASPTAMPPGPATLSRVDAERLAGANPPARDSRRRPIAVMNPRFAHAVGAGAACDRLEPRNGRTRRPLRSPIRRRPDCSWPAGADSPHTGSNDSSECPARSDGRAGQVPAQWRSAIRDPDGNLNETAVARKYAMTTRLTQPTTSETEYETMSTTLCNATP